jgi:hypothetical protein
MPRRYVAESGSEYIQVGVNLPLNLGDRQQAQASGGQLNRQGQTSDVLADVDQRRQARLRQR